MDEKKLKSLIKGESQETKRHFDVVAEGLLKEIRTVSEQVSQNSEDLTTVKEKLEEHDQHFEVIKTDLFLIKNEFKQKVSHDEFAALEKRVVLLESKINRQK